MKMKTLHRNPFMNTGNLTDTFFEKVDNDREAFFKKLEELENKEYAGVFIATYDEAQKLLDAIHSRLLFWKGSFTPINFARPMYHCKM